MHCLINQFVTETVHSFDFDRGSGLFEFAAQIFDLRINEMEIIGLIDMIPPYGFGQNCLIDHMTRTLHEIRKNIELLFQ